MFKSMKYFGSSAIGEKGQVVVPAKLRKAFGIEAGDNFLVLAGEQLGAWGIILVKSDVLAEAVQDMFGQALPDFISPKKKSGRKTPRRR